MRKVTVQGQPYTVASGIVGLTADQARTRGNNLKAVKSNKDGSGEYEVLSPIQFKIGESFLFGGTVGKDGRLYDPEAEQLAQLEERERIAAEVRASVTKEVAERVRAELLAKLPEDLRASVEKALAAPPAKQ